MLHNKSIINIAQASLLTLKVRQTSVPLLTIHKKKNKYQMPISISISPDFKQKCPNIRLGCIQATVTVATTYPSLLEKINQKIAAIQNIHTAKTLSTIPTIAATRTAYKALGKDPSRYRPSAHALLRRVVQGKGLYHINNLVDLLNLVSISSGFSIGGYDFEKIEGSITLSVGIENEPYLAIGRGQLNIGGLPTLRDNVSAFGSPTSDSQRTMVTNDTTQFLMVFFDFNHSPILDDALALSVSLLEEFAQAKHIKSIIF